MMLGRVKIAGTLLRIEQSNWTRIPLPWWKLADFDQTNNNIKSLRSAWIRIMSGALQFINAFCAVVWWNANILQRCFKTLFLYCLSYLLIVAHNSCFVLVNLKLADYNVLSGDWFLEPGNLIIWERKSFKYKANSASDKFSCLTSFSVY